MTKKLIEQVSFSITGEFMTNYARERALEGEWDSAISFLKDNLIGMTEEQAGHVVSGHAKITGDTRLRNITMEQDDDSEEYKASLREFYFDGLFSHNNVIYKALEVIREDSIKEMAKKEGIRNMSNHDFYSIDLVEHLIKDKHEFIFTIDDYNHLLARRTYHGEIVEFMDKKEIPSLEDFYEANYNAQLSPDGELKKAEEKLKNRILAVCEKRGVTWKTETVLVDGKEHSLRFPVEIMQAYIEKESHKFWTPVSPIGWKMQNDSAWHTDLWLAMGLSSEASYDFDSDTFKAFQEVVNKYRFKDLRSDNFVNLTHIPLLQFTGTVKFENSENITDRDILILPNANLKYEKIAKKAGIVVVESGTELSHLAMYGKQESLPVLQMRKALSIFKEGEVRNVDFINQTIKLFQEKPAVKRPKF